MPLEVAAQLGSVRAGPAARRRILRQVADVNHRSVRTEMFAFALVNEPEKSGGARQLGGVLARNAAQDTHDLNVLPPLEHRRGDQKTEQRAWITAAKLLGLDGEEADPLRISKRRRHAGVVAAPEVPLEVPTDNVACHVDLSTRRPRSCLVSSRPR